MTRKTVYDWNNEIKTIETKKHVSVYSKLRGFVLAFAISALLNVILLLIIAVMIWG